MIRLTSDQANRALSFMSDICIATGIVANTKPSTYTDTRYCIINADSSYSSTYKEAASTIIKCITRRTKNFNEVERAISTLKRYRARFGDTPTSDVTQWEIRKEETIAKYIAWFCAEQKLFWDDTSYDPEERKSLVESSYFAHALYDAECFVSQPTRTVRTRTAKAAGGDPTGAPGTPGVPKSGYKSSGPQSANVAGLVGTPGEKVSAGTSTVFCIVAAKAGTIIPNAFITPVENPAAGVHAKVDASGLPVVKFGAGNGYTDLTIYSTSSSVMEEIRAKLGATGLLAKYSDVHVAEVKANSSGYFKINTALGQVLVKPTKLNEKLFTEAFKEMCESANKDTEFPSIDKDAISDIKQFVRDSKMYD